jgi:hypothetical protein
LRRFEDQLAGALKIRLKRRGFSDPISESWSGLCFSATALCR